MHKDDGSNNTRGELLFRVRAHSMAVIKKPEVNINGVAKTLLVALSDDFDLEHIL